MKKKEKPTTSPKIVQDELKRDSKSSKTPNIEQISFSEELPSNVLLKKWLL